MSEGLLRIGECHDTEPRVDAVCGLVRQVQALRIGLEEAHLRQARRPVLGQIQEGGSDIDPDDAPDCTDTLGQLQGGLSCTTADIDDRVAQFRIQGVDRAHPQRGTTIGPAARGLRPTPGLQERPCRMLLPNARPSTTWLDYGRHDTPVRRTLQQAPMRGLAAVWDEVEAAGLTANELR